MPHFDSYNGYTQVIPLGTKAIREGVAAHFGITRHEVIRDQSRCAQHGSEHCVCRGIDWYTTDIAKGTRMRAFLIWAADILGIQSAIFNNIVWGFGRWYERSPASSPHQDHVHGGINKWGATNVTRAMVDAALQEWEDSQQEDDMFEQTDKERLERVEAVLSAILVYLGSKDPDAVGKAVGRGDILSDVDFKVALARAEGFSHATGKPPAAPVTPDP